MQKLPLGIARSSLPLRNPRVWNLELLFSVCALSVPPFTPIPLGHFTSSPLELSKCYRHYVCLGARSSRGCKMATPLLQHIMVWKSDWHICLWVVGTGDTFAPASLFGIELSTSGKESNPRLASLNTLGLPVWTSRGAGLVLAYDGGLILLPMLRNFIRVLRPKLIVCTCHYK